MPADNRKAHQDLQKVVEKYVAGQASYKDVEAAEKKCIKSGGLADFRNKGFLDEKRHAYKVDFIKDQSISAINPAWWQKAKKDAGVKGSGLFKKADASVGKFISKFRSDVDAWKKTVNAKDGNAAGDGKKLISAIQSSKALDQALAKFLAAKEFKTDLSQELQKKVLDLRKDLAGQVAWFEMCQKQHIAKKQALVADLKKAGIWS